MPVLNIVISWKDLCKTFQHLMWWYDSYTICSLCWLWIFYLTSFRDFSVYHSCVGSLAEWHRESFSSSMWMMGKQSKLHSCAQRHTDRHLEVLPCGLCGDRYEMPHGRLVRQDGCAVSVRDGCHLLKHLCNWDFLLQQTFTQLLFRGFPKYSIHCDTLNCITEYTSS